jgi:hypothetical protein
MKSRLFSAVVPLGLRLSGVAYKPEMRIVLLIKALSCRSHSQSGNKDFFRISEVLVKGIFIV